MTRLLTVSGAAHRLACAESTVRKMIDTGKLPLATRLSNGTRLVRPADVDALAAQRGSDAR